MEVEPASDAMVSSDSAASARQASRIASTSKASRATGPALETMLAHQQPQRLVFVSDWGGGRSLPVCTRGADLLIVEQSLPLHRGLGWRSNIEGSLTSTGSVDNHLHTTVDALLISRCATSQEATPSEKTADETAWTPKDLLPAFEVEGRRINGSVNLMQYLEDGAFLSALYHRTLVLHVDAAFPEQEPHLLSLEPVERARQRVWTDFIRRTVTQAFIK